MSKKWLSAAIAVLFLISVCGASAEAACCRSIFSGCTRICGTYGAVTSASKGSSAQATQTVQSSDKASQVIAETNVERARYGLGTLTADAELTRAACVRAQEIAQSFSHTRPDGSSWSTVSTRAYAENIARGYATADKVVAAWMTSSGHRANILRAHYTKIGVCALNVNGVMYWVQLFGR